MTGAMRLYARRRRRRRRRPVGRAVLIKFTVLLSRILI